MRSDREPTGAAGDELLARLAAASVDDILGLLCEQTRLEVAFVGEFTGGRRIIRYAVGAAAQSTVLLQRDDDVMDSYCRLIAERPDPSLIPDVRHVPQLQRLAVTAELGIGAYIGVPVRLRSGDLYGTLCCLGHEAVDGFAPAVREVLSFAAACVARQLEAPEHCYVNVLDQQERIRALLDDPEGLRIVFQPIVDITTGDTVGYEALSRFPGAGSESPAAWFADAHHVGLGIELELAAIHRALEVTPPAEQYVALNVSGATLDSPELWELLHEVDPVGLVLELTEQDAINAAAMLERRRVIAEHGIRLAVDDLGAGFSTLSRLLELEPDVVKFDRFLTAGIAEDPRRRALAAATHRFCEDVDTVLVAEGVEELADLGVLRDLGFRYVQGYATGRPASPVW